MPRLCYLSTSVIPSRDANSVHVMKMCHAFAKQGWDITLFAKPKRDGELEEDPYAFYGVPNSFDLRYHQKPLLDYKKLWFLRRLRRAVRVEKPDLIYGRDLRGLRAVAREQVPLIFESHIFPEDPKRQSEQEDLFRSESFKSLVVISKALAEAYREAFGALLDGRLKVAHDGADDPGSSLAELRPLGARLRAGYLGHLYPGKGMELLSEILPLAPEVDFEIVGGKPEQVADWRERLSGYPNIRFRGFVEPSKVAEVISGFDVALAPFSPRIEGAGGRQIERWMSPLKIFEYMAAGRPILCSDLPVLREVLAQGKTALLLPADQPDAWARALQDLSRDEAKRQRLAHAARQDFLANYSWNARAKALLEG